MAWRRSARRHQQRHPPDRPGRCQLGDVSSAAEPSRRSSSGPAGRLQPRSFRDPERDLLTLLQVADLLRLAVHGNLGIRRRLETEGRDAVARDVKHLYGREIRADQIYPRGELGVFRAVVHASFLARRRRLGVELQELSAVVNPLHATLGSESGSERLGLLAARATEAGAAKTANTRAERNYMRLPPRTTNELVIVVSRGFGSAPMHSDSLLDFPRILIHIGSREYRAVQQKH